METLDILPINPVVGAIASGVDLTRPLDADTVGRVRRAVLDRGVVFFRGQDLTREQMAAFMKNFGTLCTDPFSVAALNPPSVEATVHLMPTYGNRRATAI